MRLNRRRKIVLVLAFGGISIYLVFPLLVRGIEFFLTLFWGVVLLLSALPQILWWAAGVGIVIFWGLLVLMNLGMGRLLHKKKEATFYNNYQGRLRTVRERLLGAVSGGRYLQGELKSILRSLAIDLISLKLDISEEEARKIFFQGNWTEDKALKAYLSLEVPWGEEESRFGWRFRRAKMAGFLEDTQKALHALQSYRNFPYKGKELET